MCSEEYDKMHHQFEVTDCMIIPSARKAWMDETD